MNQSIYTELLEGNKEWVAEKLLDDADFFKRHATGQTPKFLWIGCSDSRVNPTEITKTGKGDIFVHRNIANMVVHTDLNMLSVLQYAVEVLLVEHVIVCGHYGCGGVNAAMDNQDRGLVNNWLLNIKEVYFTHKKEILALDTLKKRQDRLVELNVIDQVYNLAETSIIQRAWKKRGLKIHGWVYSMESGIITELDTIIDERDDLDDVFKFEI